MTKAKEIAKKISGAKCVDLGPWNPETDLKVSGWIRKVETNETGTPCTKQLTEEAVSELAGDRAEPNGKPHPASL
jgi:hypothetical protein